MEEKQIPFVVYEAAEARSERHIKRLIIALVISLILTFASNAIWLYAWCQYDYSSEDYTYTQGGEGYNNINTGTQGDVNNGSDVKDKEANPQIKE